MSIPLRVLDVIRRIVRLLREGSHRSESALGLSTAQLFVLQKLDGDRPLSLNELAAKTFTHQSSVSVVVSRLVESGLVRRRPAKRDKRRLELELTAAGQALLGRSPALPQDRIVAAIESLSRADQTRLAGALEQLGAALGLEEAAPPMLFESPSPSPTQKKKKSARGIKARRKS